MHKITKDIDLFKILILVVGLIAIGAFYSYKTQQFSLRMTYDIILLCEERSKTAHDTFERALNNCQGNLDEQLCRVSVEKIYAGQWGSEFINRCLEQETNRFNVQLAN